MKIKTRREREATIIEISGRIDVYTASAVGEAIQSAIEDGPARVILNLASVSIVDSSGLGTLVGNAQTVNSLGGSVSLIGLRPRLKRILNITGLCRYFDLDGCMEERLGQMELTGVGETPVT